MNVVPNFGNGRKPSVVMVDAFGKVQLTVVPTEFDHGGERGAGLHKIESSEALASVLGESSCDMANAVAVAAHGTLLVLVYATHFTIKSVLSGAIVEEISLGSSPLCSQEDPSVGAHLIGGTFLQCDELGARLESKDSKEGSVDIFAVWSTNGAAIIYALEHSDVNFSFEPLCQIPALTYPSNVNALVRFCQLGHCLVRTESVAFDVHDSVLWRPHLTIWAVHQLPHMHADGSEELGRRLGTRTSSNSDSTLWAILLGEGGLPYDNSHSWASLSNVDFCCGAKIANKGEASGRNSHQNIGADMSSPVWNKGIVSSSMVLSQDCHAPYAVVYGFYSGEIEMIRFGNLFPEPCFLDGFVYPGTGLCISQQSFSGHTGAVLCLAAHHMVSPSHNHHALQILISGGLDGTVHIWDLDAGSVVLVMHHHVAPVKQIILPPSGTDHPWSDCFLSVGEDSCVALASLETLRVERIFHGHPCYPSMVAWDSTRGYIACLCKDLSSVSDTVNSLYIWDVKTGARERILRGTASHSMFDHFCRGINLNTNTGNRLGGTTSASSLLLSLNEDAKIPNTHTLSLHKGILPNSGNAQRRGTDLTDSIDPLNCRKDETSGFIYDVTGNSSNQVSLQDICQNRRHPIRGSCPLPGVAALEFDLSLLMSLYQMSRHSAQRKDNQVNINMHELDTKYPNSRQEASSDGSDVQWTEGCPPKESLEGFLLRFSLSFLHLWDIDHELDKLLVDEMHISKPGPFVASGVLGDRGSLTLIFPDLHSTLELWKCSSELCAMRSLTMVSLAQRMICLSNSSSVASSALAAFYTRNFAEKVPDVKPPLLQLLVSFWQDPSEHVRMAARSLFHCAAPRAIPHSLYCHKTIQSATFSNPADAAEEHAKSNQDAPVNKVPHLENNDENEDSSIVDWLESYEIQDWISCIGGTAQDAMASHIIVAAALAVWYPSIVKSGLAKLVVDRLIKLVMAMNDRYSSTAAELLAEGMDSTWKEFIDPEIPHLIGDVFFQVECLSSGSTNNAIRNPAVAINIRETLVGILLPSLAMADISGFLTVIGSQIWSTSSDSPVHLVSLNTLIRVVRGSPKPLLQYIDKVVNYVLQTMDHGNLVMRKVCLHSSMVALREVARLFPMVALNERTSRLAIGDAIGDICSVTIRVYDLESVTKIKVLDASGPPGLPSLLAGASDTVATAAITALSFSPDGEGLVAFSEHGLTIRWWSLGTAWWEKLSRSTIPVQCTKLIFVPPWEGFSPNSSRSSIMASITGHHNRESSQEKTREPNDTNTDSLKILLHNLDLSYRLEWVDGRKVVLTRHAHELGCFQL
uniref:WD repeat-containing protein 7 n=1 Tax=Anthurium amnicola TaxID=1678845 RepID=A0A1D1ZAP5_9ARAE